MKARPPSGTASDLSGGELAQRRDDTGPLRPSRGRPRLTEPSEEFLRRKEQIIETAAKVFHDRGYESGTLDDVAAALDLRKASLYYYVKSKSQLLYWIFDRAISLALARLRDLSEIPDPAERLAAFIVHQVVTVSTERSMFAVFFDSRPRLARGYEEAIRRKEREYLQFYVDAVAEAVAAGALPEIEPRHGAQAILGMCSWVYKWIADEPEPARAAADFVKLILRMEPPHPVA
jgi:AcrR family transcriptional regulator